MVLDVQSVLSLSRSLVEWFRHKALNETKVKLNRGDTKVERVQAL